jgi:hypothetical protein
MQPNEIYEVKIIISGFTKTQVENGLPGLLNEFGLRPWLFNTQASWDDSINKLVIIVGYEFEVNLEGGAFDEISDCVLANMNFDNEIEFDIQRI